MNSVGSRFTTLADNLWSSRLHADNKILFVTFHSTYYMGRSLACNICSGTVRSSRRASGS